ncbi:uncharacterized protein ARMOST_20386 [Armillaria ostoyae]|uniref:Uncharacterized protein n=1 Tax=Armillaria ostoyae TaxID=47428 RepID=A0A284S7A9_ARMOS|nr:uncharacterized protein ARMOST_20386 [Armillaria ostoyae]
MIPNCHHLNGLAPQLSDIPFDVLIVFPREAVIPERSAERDIGYIPRLMILSSPTATAFPRKCVEAGELLLSSDSATLALQSVSRCHLQLSTKAAKVATRILFTYSSCKICQPVDLFIRISMTIARSLTNQSACEANFPILRLMRRKGLGNGNSDKANSVLHASLLYSYILELKKCCRIRSHTPSSLNVTLSQGI